MTSPPSCGPAAGCAELGMVEKVINQQIQAAQATLRPFLELVTQVPVHGVPVIANFLAGNPQEPTLPGFVAALQRWSVPASTDWFAYRMMHEPAREAAAASLTAELGLDFAAPDVFLTRGASGAIALALSTVVDPGDEVVFLSPPWFFYEAMIIVSGAFRFASGSSLRTSTWTSRASSPHWGHGPEP